MAEIELPRRVSDFRGTPKRRAVRAPNIEDVPQVGMVSDPGLNVPQQAFGDFSGVEAAGNALQNLGQMGFREAGRQQKLYDATESNERSTNYRERLREQYLKQSQQGDWADSAQHEIWQTYIKNEKVEALRQSEKSKLSETGRVNLERQVDSIGSAYARAGDTAHLRAVEARADTQMQSTINEHANSARNKALSPADIDAEIEVMMDSLRAFEGTRNQQAYETLVTTAQETVIMQGLVGMALNGQAAEARSALKSGRFSDKLRVGSRNTIEAAIKRADNEHMEVARAELATSLKNNYAQIAATGTSTGNFSKDRFSAAYPNKKLAALKHKEAMSALKIAKTLYDVGQDIKKLPSSESFALVNSLKPTLGDPNFAQRQDAYEAAQQSWQQERASRLTDGAAAAERNDALKKARTSMPWADYVGLRMETQKKAGYVNVRALTNKEADEHARRLMTGKAPQRLQTLEAMRAGYGESLFRTVMMELGKLNKVPLNIQLAAGIPNSVIQERFLIALDNQDETRKKINSAETGKFADIQKEVRQLMDPYRRAATTSGLNWAALSRMNELDDAIATYAASLYLTGTEQDADDAAKKAVQDILESRFAIYENGNNAVLIPKLLEGNHISPNAVIKAMEDVVYKDPQERMASAIRDFGFVPLTAVNPDQQFMGILGKDDNGRDVVGDGENLWVNSQLVTEDEIANNDTLQNIHRKMTDAARIAGERHEQALRAITDNPFWIPNEDQTGVYLTHLGNDGQPVKHVNADGKPLTIYFKDHVGVDMTAVEAREIAARDAHVKRYVGRKRFPYVRQKGKQPDDATLKKWEEEAVKDYEERIRSGQ